MPLSYDQRPDTTEFAPYYRTYMDKVPSGDILALLDQQIDETAALLDDLSFDLTNYRYAPEKWSVGEVVGHMIDTERIFAYRALCLSRGEVQELPGFDQDEYVRKANFDQRTLPALLDELKAVRQSTLLFFRGLSDEQMARRGTANGVTFSVRALAYIIAGHERHHVDVLKKRYLT